MAGALVNAGGGSPAQAGQAAAIVAQDFGATLGTISSIAAAAEESAQLNGGGAGGEAGAGGRPDLRMMFTAMDLDGSGAVSRGEMQEASPLPPPFPSPPVWVTLIGWGRR